MTAFTNRSAATPFSILRKIPSWGWILGVSLTSYAIVSMLILRAEGSPPLSLQFDLNPIAAASLAIRIHVISALSALAIGTWLLLAPKGRTMHRTFGWMWVVAMGVTAISSFFITGLMGSSYSPIHALSAWTLLGLPFGIAAVKRRDIRKHRASMTNMFMGAIIVAGLFSFLPGRMLWHVFFTV